MQLTRDIIDLTDFVITKMQVMGYKVIKSSPIEVIDDEEQYSQVVRVPVEQDVINQCMDTSDYSAIIDLAIDQLTNDENINYSICHVGIYQKKAVSIVLSTT